MTALRTDGRTDFVELVLDNCQARVVSTAPLRFAIADVEAAVEVGKGRTLIAIPLLGLDGFELRMARGDAWFDDDLGHPMLDRDYGIETNDVPLARWWMDATARAAVADARYAVLRALRGSKASSNHPPRSESVRKWWSVRIAEDWLRLTADAELDGSYVGLALPQAAAIATRFQRWIAALPELAVRTRRVSGLGEPFADAADGDGRRVELMLTRSPLDGAARGFALVATSMLDTQGGVVLARDDLDGTWWGALRASIDADHRNRRKLGRDDAPAGYTLATDEREDAGVLAPLVAHPAFATDPPAVVRLRAGAVDLMWTAEHADLGRGTISAALALRRCLGGAVASGPYR